LRVGEQKEGLAITVRFFQTSKRPISFTHQTLKYRHLCRSALITALQLFQISQHAPRRFRVSGDSVYLNEYPVQADAKLATLRCRKFLCNFIR
jgi:hypothetical protein